MTQPHNRGACDFALIPILISPGARARGWGGWVGHFLLLGPMLIAIGCSHSNRPDTVTVRGRITLDGGDWPVPGLLLFTPTKAAEGFPLRPGTAPFDEQGNFAAGTWEAGDGLMPGSYKIVVECWTVPPTMDGPPAQGHVPPKYQTATTTDLNLEIEPGSGPQTLQLDIPL